MLVQADSGGTAPRDGNVSAACLPLLPAAGAETSPTVSAPNGPQKVTPHPESLPRLASLPETWCIYWPERSDCSPRTTFCFDWS